MIKNNPYICGIDLAWHCDKNNSAMAFGELIKGELIITDLIPSIKTIPEILQKIKERPSLTGLAIDASLIIPNQTGQRFCEQQLNSFYQSKKAGCHPTNKTLYPNADSVRLSQHLTQLGFCHLNHPERGCWQLECYPHPAIIELFALTERHLYKKGSVATKRQGQITLAKYLNRLHCSQVLKLTINTPYQYHLEPNYIAALKGHTLKQNEDTLDAIICAYIGGLYLTGVNNQCFGDTENGYIYVPQQKCI